MDKLKPFTRDILEFELAPFSGGAKFRNGDTIMARITPCLENGKTAKVNILENIEVGFGSSGRQRVQTDVIQNLHVMVPSLEEQRKIVSVLKALDDKNAINTEINDNLAA